MQNIFSDLSKIKLEICKCLQINLWINEKIYITIEIRKYFNSMIKI